LLQLAIQSSGYDRTLKSAAANTAGLFPPTSKESVWDMDETIRKVWQPVPIASRSVYHDAIFNIAPCLLSEHFNHISEGLKLGYLVG